MMWMTTKDRPSSKLCDLLNPASAEESLERCGKEDRALLMRLTLTCVLVYHRVIVLPKFDYPNVYR